MRSQVESQAPQHFRFICGDCLILPNQPSVCSVISLFHKSSICHLPYTAFWFGFSEMRRPCCVGQDGVSHVRQNASAELPVRQLPDLPDASLRLAALHHRGGGHRPALEGRGESAAPGQAPQHHRQRLLQHQRVQTCPGSREVSGVGAQHVPQDKRWDTADHRVDWFSMSDNQSTAYRFYPTPSQQPIGSIWQPVNSR